MSNQDDSLRTQAMTKTLTDAEIAEIQRIVATTSARRHGWSNNTVMALLATLDAKEAELQKEKQLRDARAGRARKKAKRDKAKQGDKP